MSCPAAGIAMVQRDELPCCRLGNQFRKALAETRHWCCSHQSFFQDFSLLLFVPSISQKERSCLAGFFVSHVYLWVCLWSWLLLKTRGGRGQKGQEGCSGTEKLAGMSWTFAALPGIFKCFIRSAWHGPVSHRILRGPSETCLRSREPASPPSWLCTTSGRY